VNLLEYLPLLNNTVVIKVDLNTVKSVMAAPPN